jgi:hypothetical protein
MDWDKITILGLALAFGLGIVGLVGLFVSFIKQWLMSPPKAKNNRFMGREFIDYED